MCQLEDDTMNSDFSPVSRRPWDQRIAWPLYADLSPRAEQREEAAIFLNVQQRRKLHTLFKLSAQRSLEIQFSSYFCQSKMFFPPEQIYYFILYYIYIYISFCYFAQLQSELDVVTKLP